MVCGVVACKDNDKVGECGNNGVTGRVGCDDDRLVVVVFVVGEVGIERTSPRALP